MVKVLLGLFLVVFLMAGGFFCYRDWESASLANEVNRYIKTYCKKKNRYPTLATLLDTFPMFSQDDQWFYWVTNDHSSASFQYPMRIPIPGAPGEQKYSEFGPIIYSYSVQDPCKDL